MKSQTRRTTAVAGFMLTACLTPECARPQDLHGSVTLYGWLPGPDAEVTSTRGGVSASTSVRARDVLEALNIAFTATGQVNYGCFGLVQDVVYPDPGTSGNLSGPLASKVNVDTNLLILSTAIGYRAYDEDGWPVEPFAGGRYVDLEQDVRITGGGPRGTARLARYSEPAPRVAALRRNSRERVDGARSSRRAIAHAMTLSSQERDLLALGKDR